MKGLLFFVFWYHRIALRTRFGVIDRPLLWPRLYRLWRQRCQVKRRTWVPEHERALTQQPCKQEVVLNALEGLRTDLKDGEDDKAAEKKWENRFVTFHFMQWPKQTRFFLTGRGIWRISK